MKTMTKNLSGVALDWAVAKCEGLTPLLHLNPYGCWVLLNIIGSYSTDWACGGPIIEREHIVCSPRPGYRPVGAGGCEAHIAGVPFSKDCRVNGETYLIAAMRCYVASKMGEEIDVPEMKEKP